MKYTAPFIVIVIMFAACAKERQCECKNSNNTYTAGKIEATKRAAKKHCQSLSGGETTCYLK